MVSISRHHAKGKYKGNMMISTFFFEITYDDLYLSSVENRPGHGSPNPIQSTRKRPDPTRPDHTTGRAQAKFFTQNPNKPGPAWKITIKIWTWRNLTRPCHGSSSSQQFWPTNPTRPMTRSSWKHGAPPAFVWVSDSPRHFSFVVPKRRCISYEWHIDRVEPGIFS